MKRQKLITVLLLLIIIPLSVDGLLHVFDPWGAERYAHDMARNFEYVIPDPARIYVMRPGVYQFSNWTATILSDNSRAVPATNTSAACTIALLGDSVTYGFGLSDADTWANVLAVGFPQVRIVNTGVNGYNIEDVGRTLQVTPANGYLYMMIDNDAEAEFPYDHLDAGEKLSAISLYLRWLQIFRGVSAAGLPDYTAFYATLDKLSTRPDLAIVGFDDSRLTIDAQKHDPALQILPRWTHNNSRVDPHPNADGAREIAAEVKPIFAELVSKVCGG